MKKHKWKAVLAAAVPLFCIFLSPILGIRQLIALFIFILIMFGAYWTLTISDNDKDDYWKDKKIGCHRQDIVKTPGKKNLRGTE